MAGIRITQLRPQHATGRRYGSFAGKSAVSTTTHPVGKITQLRPQRATGMRYGSFAGKLVLPIPPIPPTPIIPSAPDRVTYTGPPGRVTANRLAPYLHGSVWKKQRRDSI